MKDSLNINRRSLLKRSIVGFAAVSFPPLLFAKDHNPVLNNVVGFSGIGKASFPNIDPEIVAEVVGKSHFNLDRVKELVDVRPELSRSTWEWQFGDFESAIGAASHVGRRDIAQYLMSKGARPTIFTFAMLGAYNVVKSMIEYNPGIQQKMGPHGISLLRHANAGNRMKDSMSLKERDDLKRLIDYLEELGDAGGESYLEVSAEEQKKYLGDYKYGDGPEDGFSIKLNMRKDLSLGKLGKSGGSLFKIGENTFTYNGAPSVTITFKVENDVVKSLTIEEPGNVVTASKIS